MTNTATELARAVVSTLGEAGVTDVVIAPGSRNAPLSFAAYDAAAAGLMRLHTRIDERSAGFLAVGLTKVGARAAVMCTSGTAVANLHPAVLEAAHAGVPLVVVTADRPARLRGTNANQTTDQVGIFGPLVATHDLSGVDETEAAILTEGAGPVHLNVQLDEPLVPGDRWEPAPGPAHASAARLDTAAFVSLPAGPRTVVVAEPLLPVRGMLPVGVPAVVPEALHRVAADPARVAHWQARRREVEDFRRTLRQDHR